MCIDPSGGGGASSWKRFTISCYIFISPAGRSIFFCQFYLVLWSEKATVKWCRTSAPRLAWNDSLSQVCEDLVVVYSLHSSIQGPWRQEIGIFNMSVFNRKAWASCPLSQSRRFHVCVCVFVYKKMTRWHFLVSCGISVIVTCRFLSVSPAQSSSKISLTATEPSRAHSPSVKIGENGWDGSLVRKHSWIPVTKRSPLSPRAPVFSQESEAMSRWRRNFTLLFFQSNSLIYSRNKQMRLITFVTPRLYITSQICGIRTEL